MHKPLTGLLAGCVLCLSTGEARADDENPAGFLLPGVLWGLSPAKTLGAELSYAHYPDGCCRGFGPRIDAEWLRPRGPMGGTYRASIGGEVFYAGLGVEASLSRQGARHLGPRADFGASVGAFASLGFGSIGVRHAWSFADGDPPVTALVFTAKWVVLVYGEQPYRLPASWTRVPSGRPLLVARAGRTTPSPIVASLGRSRAWTVAEAAPRADETGTLRQRLLAAIAR